MVHNYVNAKVQEIKIKHCIPKYNLIHTLLCVCVCARARVCVRVCEQRAIIYMSAFKTCMSWYVFIIGMMCYAELGTLILKSGGEYSYLLAAYGSVAAFLFSWVSVFLLKPASNAIMAATCANYILLPFHGEACSKPPDLHVKLLTIIILSKTP